MKFKKFTIYTKESLYKDQKRIFRYGTIFLDDLLRIDVKKLTYITCTVNNATILILQELLLERADLFYHFRSGPAGAVTQEDILDISDALQEDSR